MNEKRCGNCGDLGHESATCREAYVPVTEGPVSNTKQGLPVNCFAILRIPGSAKLVDSAQNSHSGVAAPTLLRVICHEVFDIDMHIEEPLFCVCEKGWRKVVPDMQSFQAAVKLSERSWTTSARTTTSRSITVIDFVYHISFPAVRQKEKKRARQDDRTIVDSESLTADSV